eukprot:scpid41682/ scgid27910/ Syntaxin-binding protein 5-like; Lethal(2) giant larvae protein homolog 4; Tomosyn-2
MEIFKRAKAAIRALKGVPEIEEHLNRDAFGLAETVRHGFPHMATTLAVDHVQGLIAVGNRSGVIRIFGRPAVEVSVRHEVKDFESCQVLHLAFMPNEGALLSATSDNTLHMWDLKSKEITVAQSVHFDEESVTAGAITSLCAPIQSDWIYVGLSSGNVFMVNAKTFQVSGYTIYWNKVVELSQRARPGAVNAILEHPTDCGKILIVYDHLLVLWDLRRQSPVYRCPTKEAVRGADWSSDGKSFMTGLRNGSLATWNSKDGKLMRMTRPHAVHTGELACHGIHKLKWMSTKDEPIVFFTGGMPVQQDGMTNTLTILSSSQELQVVEYESRVVDFCLLKTGVYPSDTQDPHSVVVLLEDTIEVIDLLSPSCNEFTMPYDITLQSPTITSVLYEGDLPAEVVGLLVSAGSKQVPKEGSTRVSRSWPLTGGSRGKSPTKQTADLIVTGHIDGSVRFWESTSTTLMSLYTFDSAVLYEPRKTTCRSKSAPSSPTDGAGAATAHASGDETDGPFRRQVPSESSPNENWDMVEGVPTEEDTSPVTSAQAAAGGSPTEAPRETSGNQAAAAQAAVRASPVAQPVAPAPVSAAPIATPIGGPPATTTITPAKQQATAAAAATTPPVSGKALPSASSAPRCTQPTTPGPSNKEPRAVTTPEATTGGNNTAASSTPRQSLEKSPDSMAAEMPQTEPAELAAAPTSLRFPFAIRHMRFCRRSLSLTLCNELSSVVVCQFGLEPREVREILVSLANPHCPNPVKSLDTAPSSVAGSEHPAVETIPEDAAAAAAADPESVGYVARSASTCLVPWRCRNLAVEQQACGYHPIVCVQCCDAVTGSVSSCGLTSVATDIAHGILAIGSADGVGVFDIQRQTVILTSGLDSLKDVLCIERGERSDKPERSEKSERTENPEKTPRIDKSAKAEKSAKSGTSPVPRSPSVEGDGVPKKSAKSPLASVPRLASVDVESVARKSAKFFLRRKRKSSSKTDLPSPESAEAPPVSSTKNYEHNVDQVSEGEQEDSVSTLPSAAAAAEAGATATARGSVPTLSPAACQTLLLAETFSHQSTTDQHLYCSVWCGSSTGQVYALSLVPLPTDQAPSSVSSASSTGTNAGTGWGVYYHALYMPVCREEPITDLAVLNQHGRVLTSASKQDAAEEEFIAHLEGKPTEEFKKDQFHFLVVCSDQHSWVYALPSSGRETHKYPEATYVVKSAIVDINGSACLSALTLDGRLLAYSLPSMTPLLDAPIDLPGGVDVRTVRSFAWANGGQILYMPSSTEIQRLCMVKENVLKLPGSLPATYVEKEFPKRQEKGLFASLFSSTPEQLDRDELFGKDHSGVASQAVATRQPGSLDKLKGEVAHSNDVFSRARQNLDERGEKLNDLGLKTEKMSENASEYARNARLLAEKYQNQRWWQLF